MKAMCAVTKSRIFGEGQRAAFQGFTEKDCKYDGERREIWLSGFRSLKDES